MKGLGSTLLGTQESLHDQKATQVKSLVDTGAEISVLKTLMGLVTNEKIPVLVATDTVKDYQFTPEKKNG